MTLELERLVYYTDGSCWPNPGPGGWAVVKQVDDRFVTVARGSASRATNITMEAMAIIIACECARPLPLEIITDSLFWIQVAQEWAPKWEKQGWTNRGAEVKNLELVKQIYDLYQTRDLKFTHVRGHQGIPGNESADQMALFARTNLVPISWTSEVYS